MDDQNRPNMTQSEADNLLEQNKTQPKSYTMVAAAVLMFATLLIAGLALFGPSDGSEDDSSDNIAITGSVNRSETDKVVPPTEIVPVGFTSKYALSATEDCEEISNFVDVSMFDGPGGDYAKPTLDVSCSGEELIVKSNGMPLWEFIELTPNPLQEQDNSWTIPRDPNMATSVTQIGVEDGSNPTLGALGFTVSGLVWYGPTEGPQPDPFGDPYTNSIIDECGGHTGPAGEYHEHIIVTKCFFPDWEESQVAPIVGYALDGFPIYGPTGNLSNDSSEIVEFKSSYKATGSLEEYAWDNVEYVADQGNEYLDECNGRVQPDGSYGYHLTEGFPYIIGCFKGDASSVGGGQQQGPPPQGGTAGPRR